MSKPEIRPFFIISGDAEEAATFWASIFPDSEVKTVTSFAPEVESTMVEFTIAGQPFIVVAAQGALESTYKVSHMIVVNDQAEVDRVWDLLTSGGEPGMCGWLQDKYAIHWQVVPREMLALITDPDRKRAAAANRALMQMSKIDLASLQAAADGTENQP